VGFKLTGKLSEGITATDLVLTVTQMLRKHGVVGKFVEFYGDGLDSLPLADRATIANMAPEYGATCGFFPIDDVTLEYMRLSGRSEEQVALVEAIPKRRACGATRAMSRSFTSTLELDMGSVEASLAGPKRPQDRVALTDVPKAFAASNALEVNVAQKDHRPGRLCSERTSVSASGRRGCDCGHYLLHQHLQPQRINGGRSAG
jgi:aconitate hydratase